jgi:hypothetical protein
LFWALQIYSTSVAHDQALSEIEPPRYKKQAGGIAIFTVRLPVIWLTWFKELFGGSRQWRRIRSMNLPRGATIFPLVVGELLYLRAVVVHHENFAIRLRRSVGIEHLVLKSHPAAGKHKPFAVGRPAHMRVVACGVGQLDGVKYQVDFEVRRTALISEWQIVKDN